MKIYVGGKVFASYNINPVDIPECIDTTTGILFYFYKNTNDNNNWYVKPTGLWIGYSDEIESNDNAIRRSSD